MAGTKRRKRLVGVMGGIIALLLVALGVIIYLMSSSAGTVSSEQIEKLRASATFADGVSMNGISLGGLTYKTAAQKMAEEETRMKQSMSIPLSLESSGWLFEADKDFGVKFNTETLLDKAIALGNSGNTVKDQSDREKIKKDGAESRISYTIDTAPVAESVKKFAASVNRPAVDATVQVVKQPEPDASASPSPSKSASPAPSASDESSLPTQLFTFTEGQSGIKVKEDEMAAAIKAKLEKGDFSEMKVPAELTQPALTSAQLQKITQKISSHRTTFKGSTLGKSNRVKNIEKASGLINGVMVLPGEEFIINDVLGPRTEKLGWFLAPGIENGVYTDQAGGGVCQVSTTLYNAVLKADLDVTKRKHHSWPSTYVPVGLDATISTGGPDFNFINNKATPVYVFSYTNVAEKWTEVQIWGEPLMDGMEIKLTSKLIEQGPLPTIVNYEMDPALPPNTTVEVRPAKPKRVAKSYKNYYQNGQLIRDPELIATDTYNAFNQHIKHSADWIPPTLDTSPLPSPAT